MQKQTGPIIVGVAIIISTCIYVYFSPYHSCMRAFNTPVGCVGR